MKLRVLQEDLNKAVSQSLRFVNPRVQLPILGNIILKASKTNLSLMATNLELSIARKIGADVSEEGEVAVPGKVLAEIVTNLQRGQVSLEAEKEQLKIKSSGFSGTVSGMNTTDFPKIAQALGSGSVSLDSKVISGALVKVFFCVSTDETRPVLNGVLFLFRKKSLILVATDGFRLSQKTVDLPASIDIEKIILPKSAVGELLRSNEESKEIKLEVKEKESQIVFGVGESVLSSRIISGDFPKFEDIIPKSVNTKVFVDKEELLRVVKLASVFARDNANMVKFEVGKDKIKVSAESSKSGKQEGELEAKVEGEEMEITFNYRFLEELLNVIDGDEVVIELTNTTSPGVFKDPKDPNFLHLIMPVRIQN